MNKYSTFLMPYITMMVALFTISTISMDEQNNGYAYLFALPFSRKEYVKEKYCYCLENLVRIRSLFSDTRT